MSQRTQWHVTRSHKGHMTDPEDPSAGEWDPRDPGPQGDLVQSEDSI